MNWTGGFSIENISSDFAFRPDWEVRPLTEEENATLHQAVRQPYFYLGKGCQSYVFVSADEKYVIKFFKYQRFRPQAWLSYLPPLPALALYRQEKMEKRQKKLEGFMQSWKIAFNQLKNESGLLCVHLNKTKGQLPQLLLFDKTGGRHEIDLDQMEFYVQAKSTMLCETLLDFKQKGHLTASQLLIENLLSLLLSEYERGIGDNDHALMQNTGVSAEGKPIHIDIGQFSLSEAFKLKSVQNQELFTKTHRFLQWLRDHYPEAGDYLEQRLKALIGPSYGQLKPLFREHGAALLTDGCATSRQISHGLGSAESTGPHSPHRLNPLPS